MRLDTLGVDESVSILFPPATPVDELDAPVPTTVVNAAAGPVDCDVVVTFSYHDAFDDLEWVHSTQSGGDQFPHDRLREAGGREGSGRCRPSSPGCGARRRDPYYSKDWP